MSKQNKTTNSTKAELEAQVSELESKLAKSKDTKQSKGRGFITGFLVLITALLFCSSILAFWFQQTLFDTNTWVRKTSEILASTSVQRDITVKTIDVVFESVDVEQYANDLLPEKAKPLAGTIASSLKTFSTEEMQKLLSTPKFQQFWKDANRQAHTALLKTISTANQKSQPSASGEVIFIESDKVILNVEPVLSNLKSSLASSGLGFVNNLDTSSLNLKIPLATVSNLPTILLAINTINGLAVWIPLAALVFAGLTFWVSRDRRKTILQISILSSVFLVINLILVSTGGYLFVSNLTAQVSDISTLSGQVIYSSLTQDFIDYTTAALALMVLIAIFAYLCGNSTAASWIRTKISGLMKSQAKAPAFKWVANNATIIITVVVALDALLITLGLLRSANITLAGTVAAGIACILLLAVKDTSSK